MSKLSQNLFASIFPLYIMVAFFDMIGYKFMILSYLFYFVMVFVAVESFISVLKQKQSKFERQFFIISIFYLFYSICSIFGYSFNRVPISLYILDIRNEILPFLFLYVGMNKKMSYKKFNHWFLYCSAFTFIVGLYLYFSMPTWYIDWKLANLNESWLANGTERIINEEYVSSRVSFTAFWTTSYQVSTFALITLIFLLNYFLKGFKSKILTIFLFISIISIIFAQERVSIVYALFLILFCFFYDLKHLRIFYKKVVFILVIVISIVLLLEITNSRLLTVFSAVNERINSIDFLQMIYERYDLHEFKNWNNYFFGTGLGSGGHDASNLGYKPSSTDSTFLKILIEKGMVGLISFLILLWICVIKAIKNYRIYLFEILIIGFFTFGFLGANFISMPQYIIFFWLSLGRIWNKRYFEEQKLTNNMSSIKI